MAEVVILGAGLTGLSVAYHLEQQGFTNYKIFEKDSTVGGLCRSVQQDGFTFDYTGHLLHISDPYFKQFIADTIGFDALNNFNRSSFIYSHETYTPYPFQVNLYGLPEPVITECIEGFIKKTNKKNPATFKEWVLANFGKGLGNQFFFSYQQKIFDFPYTKLSASWTGRFVPATSLQALLRGALAPAPAQSIGYNAQFFYPHTGGIQHWLKKIHAKLQQPVATNHEVIAIDSATKTVHFANGHSEQYTHLISTLPLDMLLERLKEKSNSTLFRAMDHLQCNSVINFNLGIKRENLSAKHWVYFPENQYPFYRLGFPHNLAQSMAPAGHSSISGELSALNRTQATINKKLAASKAAVKKLFSLTDQELVTEKIITIRHAYVIFDQWRDNNIQKLHQQLAAYNIQSIGRYGAWKYSSMQESVLEGRETAITLLNSITPMVFHAQQSEQPVR